jgi:hypothetical protein
VSARTARSSIRSEDGTASVEMVAVVPLLLLAMLAAAQLGLAGGALWSAAIAARAGARAELVGGDGAAVSRRALPQSMRAGAEIEDGGAVSVRVRVPGVLPAMPRLMLGTKAELPGDG